MEFIGQSLRRPAESRQMIRLWIELYKREDAMDKKKTLLF